MRHLHAVNGAGPVRRCRIVSADEMHDPHNRGQVLDGAASEDELRVAVRLLLVDLHLEHERAESYRLDLEAAQERIRELEAAAGD